MFESVLNCVDANCLSTVRDLFLYGVPIGLLLGVFAYIPGLLVKFLVRLGGDNSEIPN